MPLDKACVRKYVNEALLEDAAFDDITSRTFIPQDAKVRAQIVAKEDGVVCGVTIACEVFKVFDSRTTIKIRKKDGQIVRRGDIVLEACGMARSVLSCERVALNFMSYLSGISTQTRYAVKLAGPKGIQILDTRKTTPTLRYFEKYAVLSGGGRNHRLNLSDQYLVKENHLYVISRTSDPEVFSSRKNKAIFEIEVQSLEELKRFLSCGPDIIMLDNFSPSDIRKAVALLKGIFPDKDKRPLIEISGGVNLKNIAKYAIAGVDFISLGALTHSAPALDMSLDITKVYS
ncbi:MAG TPA: carboxylating nicotinate-nucleotide diphosphorylase [Candidatus Omnitrophica bacterium]|nr:carboxylating nicotinate-nucleotide diphosphorylase [Candidatus Omnitrophota bacterium]